MHEMHLVKNAEVNLNEEIIRESIDIFSKQCSKKEIIWDNKIPTDAKIFATPKKEAQDAS